MERSFKRGDHVEWNSEAGRVRGVILKKLVSNFLYKGYVHHASRREPQYLIRSDKTDHVAIHKGEALTRLRMSATNKHKSGGRKNAGNDGEAEDQP